MEKKYVNKEFKLHIYHWKLIRIFIYRLSTEYHSYLAWLDHPSDIGQHKLLNNFGKTQWKIENCLKNKIINIWICITNKA